MKQRYLWVGMVLISIGFACDKIGKPSSPIVARVGNAILTIDDLNSAIPKEYSGTINQQQRITYIKKWMDSELLCQEALRLHIHKEPGIRRRIEQMKRDLLSAEMINRTVPEIQSEIITDEAIMSYYEQNKNSFIRESDVVKYIDIVVADLKTGWEIRTDATVDNFIQLASKHSLVPVPDPLKLQYIPVQNLPPELAGVLLSLKTNAISTPLKLSDGVHIMILIDKQKSGDVCLLEEVREEIHTILMTQLQKKEIEKIISELKKKNKNEFHFELIMQDSALSEEPNTTLDTLLDSAIKN